MKTIKQFAGVGLLSVAMLQSAWAQEPESCKMVRFAEIGWADIATFKDQLGGKIYGIKPGNDGNLLIDGMIKADQFGLAAVKKHLGL